ncbi:hypothetical protein GCM10011403_25140 [Pseudohongiella nitratireducens]|uniref:DUF1059 domain-containing protein n=1 Tax=Pseudohongiella nitratireducens TaxID=1768907 RepID=A0A916QKV4_9GAMM|nr:DUF1059 domain-containing protein [Pseudohongiella nitratireducens]MDF1624440.1 DUF1059 domain-containing protein [Pseudohongiella nitratireducens]GFZ81014.1 hypothetical protein GCM10011403_25140 [Pseudohongiella nitratireducens]|tara:strand:+ start:1898 stop:2137 length:240 start_codon:yes stop_codon:yes gene_type:complete
MKTMTCEQLGGACDAEFQAETFDEIAQKAQQHGMEMLEIQDPGHLEAMQRIQVLMQDPQAMNNWYEGKQKEFENLPEDS